MKIIPWTAGTIPQGRQCYSGIPNHVYHGHNDWYGSSMIKYAVRSAESFFYEIGQPHKDSIALERGSAFHVGVEGLATDGNMDLFDSHAVESSGATIKSKSWQTDKSENPNKAVLPIAEIEKARAMAEKLFYKASEVNYFADGWPELSFFWIDEETGIKLKCRPDWFRPDAGGWILEYKSSKAHNFEVFSKEIANYNYHLSAAMYLEGVFQVTGIVTENYDFLVVANTPPFEVEAYPLDDASIIEGRALFRKCLRDIAGHVADKKLKRKTISLPRWAFKLTCQD